MIKLAVKFQLHWYMPANGTGHFWRKLQKEINDAAKDAAMMFRYRLRNLISISVGRSKGGKVIQRSKPGEPPRRETAELWRSIAVFQDRPKTHTIIYTNTQYAKELELGNSKIAPRPAWIPAFFQLWQVMAYSIRLRIQNFLVNYRP